MTHTSLAFYRKEQTFQSFDSERPKSLETVRQCSYDAIKDVEARLVEVEAGFHKQRSAEDDIRSILPSMRLLMARLEVYYFHASWQMRALLDQARQSQLPLHDELMAAAFEVNRYNEKIMTHLPKEFTPLTQDIIKIQSCLEKYCRSFYKGGSEVYLESARHYESTIKSIKQAIKMHLDNVQTMSDTYRMEQGVPVSAFGLHSNELARRCDIGDLPFLLIIPEACQNIRKSLEGLRMWLNEDSSYVVFLKNDIKELEKKRILQNTVIRCSQQKAVHFEKLKKDLDRNIKDLNLQILKVKHRESKFDAEIEKYETDIRMIKYDIELKENELEMNRRKMRNDKSNESSDLCERLVLDVGKLNLMIPVINKQIDHITDQKSFILKKRELLQLKTDERQQIQEDHEKAVTKLLLEQKEDTTQATCLAQLKDILICRTSPGMVKKLFQDQAIETTFRATKRSTLHREKSTNIKIDVLERGILMVSEEIQYDWPKLYRKLTSGNRGETEEEIDDILKTGSQAGVQKQAYKSLTKWRKNQPAATLSDLIKALAAIGRSDISEKGVLKKEAKPIHPLPFWKKKPSKKYQEAKDAANSFLVSKGPFRLPSSLNIDTLI